jgi:hypothetical protein
MILSIFARLSLRPRHHPIHDRVLNIAQGVRQPK